MAIVNRKKSSNVGSKDQALSQPDEKSDKDRFSRIFNLVSLFVIGLNLLIWSLRFLTPSHVKMVRENKHLVQMAQTLQNQHAYLNSRYTELTNYLSNSEQQQQLPTDSVTDSPTPPKEDAVEIASKNEELEKVKTKIADIAAVTKLFCDSCTYDVSGLRTTCGARKAFLVNHYGLPADIAAASVIKKSPGCVFNVSPLI